MKKRLNRTVLILVLLLTLTASFPFAAFAADAPDALAAPKGEIVGIANRGVWTAYPENSLAALRAVADTGLSYALADVSRTKDGALVLLAPDAAKRMLGLGSPYTADYTLEELRAKPLRNCVGGEANPETSYYVDTLTEALPQLKAAGVTPVLKFDAALAAEVTALPEAEGCVLYFTGKTKAVTAAADRYAGSFAVIAEKRSNIVFSVLSFIGKLQDAGAAGAVLKTTNRYGVNYYKSTLKHCETLRAVADTSDPATAGAREDTEKWWDDLVSRGYSAIITDDPAGFAAYLRENAAARERLEGLYAEAKDKTLPRFGAPLSSDYKKNYTDALDTAQALIADASASTLEMRDAYAALKSALKAIDMNFAEIDAGTAGSTLTLPRILLCVGAAAAVIAVQIYFFRKRKKS